ncbi:uncharacterized protein CMU_010870 [Cryptosporidium muris RN66]|uniref:Midasin n=1 Tax=Cryptosporidium muris (strain RN66) TaxID=441375 RepID=B6AIU8_CRYMR|nr:uncharacterized protein CMU_010870 [Cryptosporidium muris RN66]EEA08139.1 hypothetical protein, conserved [Cryptosporidium muris RN66]|eukprot:XP_002142488.1 hypothetical protein [Cryptosporidium muris RN66]
MEKNIADLAIELDLIYRDLLEYEKFQNLQGIGDHITIHSSNINHIKKLYNDIKEVLCEVNDITSLYTKKFSELLTNYYIYGSLTPEISHIFLKRNPWFIFLLLNITMGDINNLNSIFTDFICHYKKDSFVNINNPILIGNIWYFYSSLIHIPLIKEYTINFWTDTELRLKDIDLIVNYINNFTNIVDCKSNDNVDKYLNILIILRSLILLCENVQIVKDILLRSDLTKCLRCFISGFNKSGCNQVTSSKPTVYLSIRLFTSINSFNEKEKLKYYEMYNILDFSRSIQLLQLPRELSKVEYYITKLILLPPPLDTIDFLRNPTNFSILKKLIYPCLIHRCLISPQKKLDIDNYKILSISELWKDNNTYLNIYNKDTQSSMLKKVLASVMANRPLLFIENIMNGLRIYNTLLNVALNIYKANISRNNDNSNLISNQLSRYNGNIISLYLDSSIDSKILMGAWICGEKPGDFVWKYGILAECMINGSWLLIENIGNAPSDVMAKINEIVDIISSCKFKHGIVSRYLDIPELNSRIKIHPNFRLFGTVIVNNEDLDKHVAINPEVFKEVQVQVHDNIEEILDDEYKHIKHNINLEIEYFKLITKEMQVPNLTSDNPLSVQHSKWFLEYVNSPTDLDFKQRLKVIFPELTPFISCLISGYFNICNMLYTNKKLLNINIRIPSSRDFVISCERVSFIFKDQNINITPQDESDYLSRHFLSEPMKLKICFHACNTLADHIPFIQFRIKAYLVFCSAFNLNQAQVFDCIRNQRFMIEKYQGKYGIRNEILGCSLKFEYEKDRGENNMEEYLDTPQNNGIEFQKTLDSSLSDNSIVYTSQSNYSYTSIHSKLLYDLALSIRNNEAVLLVGDTGTGKTTVIQQLHSLYYANLPNDINKCQLLIYNFSEQSESSDLIGSYKPNYIGVDIRSLYNDYVVLLERSNISKKKNSAVLQKLTDLINKEQWLKTLQIIQKVTKTIISQYQEVICDKSKHNFGNSSKLEESKIKTNTPNTSEILIQKIYPSKKRNWMNKTNIENIWELITYWREIDATCTNLLMDNRIRNSANKSELESNLSPQFQFIDGILTRAIKEGHWIILDEINLAPNDTLQRLIPILSRDCCRNVGNCKISLYSKKVTFLIPEKGNEIIEVHPRFRLFACMNPSSVPLDIIDNKKLLDELINNTNSSNISESTIESSNFLKTSRVRATPGKRELPYLVRCLFTEYFVDEVYSRKDLEDIVYEYMKDVLITNQVQIGVLVDIYLELKSLSNKHEITIGIEGNGYGAPQYSLRTFTNSLCYIRNILCVQNQWKSNGKLITNHRTSDNILTTILDGILMSFATPLISDSFKRVEALVRRILGISKIQNISNVGTLDNLLRLNIFEAPYINFSSLTARKDLQKRSVLGSQMVKYVDINGYIINAGEEILDNEIIDEMRREFVITPSVLENLTKIVRILSGCRNPILIEGPTSTGKTSLIKFVTEITGHKFVRINNHEHTDIEEYFGRYMPSLETGNLIYTEGPLVTAARKGYWLVLDELNLAPSEVLESLNRLLDSNREIFLPETGETIKAHPDFQLFATQNPAGNIYGGRKVLSQAFRNRFVEIYIDNIVSSELVTILSSRCIIPPSYAETMVNIFTELQQHRLTSQLFSGDMSFMTVRDLLRWGNRLAKNIDKYELLIQGFFLIGERIRNEEDKVEVAQILLKNCQLLNIKLNDILSATIKEYEYEELDKKNSNRRKKPKLAITNESSIYSFLNKLQEPIKLLKESRNIIMTDTFKRMARLVNYCIEFDEPVLLVGPTGCGKTTICQEFASAKGRRLYVINCHQHIEAGDMLGSLRPSRDAATQLRQELRNLLNEFSCLANSNHCNNNFNIHIQGILDLIKHVVEIISDQDKYINQKLYGEFQLSFKSLKEQIEALSSESIRLKTDDLDSNYFYLLSKANEILFQYQKDQTNNEKGALFEWQDGPVIEAMKSGSYLLLDEINLCDDSVIERLNSLLENGKDRTITITEKSDSTNSLNSSMFIKANPNFRIFATMNPGGDYGKRELSPALRNRFTEIFIPLLSLYNLKDDIEELIRNNLRITQKYFENEDIINYTSKAILFASVMYENDLNGNENVIKNFCENNFPSMPMELLYIHGQSNNSVFSIRDVLSWSNFVSNTFNQVCNFYMDQTENELCLKSRLSEILCSCKDLDIIIKWILLILSVCEVFIHGGCLTITDYTNSNFNEGRTILEMMLIKRLLYIAVDVIITPLIRRIPSNKFINKKDDYFTCEQEIKKTIFEILEHRFIEEEGLAWITELNLSRSKAYFSEANYKNEVSIGPFKIRRLCQNNNDEICKGKSTKDRFTLCAPTSLRNIACVLRAMSIQKPILLEGSPGIGKTASVGIISKMIGMKLHRINLSEQTDLTDLFGCEIPQKRQNQSVDINTSDESLETQNISNSLIGWSDGILLRAMRQGDWVVLDELNLATQQILEGLNSIMDHRRNVYIPEIGQLVTCHPNFRIFATQNPVIEGSGRKGLPQSFLNRFTKLSIKKLNSQDYYTIGMSLYSNLPEKIIKVSIDIILSIRSYHREIKPLKNGNDWEWNLRDAIRLLELVQYNFNLVTENTQDFHISRFPGVLSNDIPRKYLHYLLQSLYHSIEIICISRLQCEIDKNNIWKIIHKKIRLYFTLNYNQLSTISNYIINQPYFALKRLEFNKISVNCYIGHLPINTYLYQSINTSNSDLAPSRQNHFKAALDLNSIPLYLKKYTLIMAECILINEPLMIGCEVEDIENITSCIYSLSSFAFDNITVKEINMTPSIDTNDLIGNFQQYNSDIIIIDIINVIKYIFIYCKNLLLRNSKKILTKNMDNNTYIGFWEKFFKLTSLYNEIEGLSRKYTDKIYIGVVESESSLILDKLVELIEIWMKYIKTEFDHREELSKNCKASLEEIDSKLLLLKNNEKRRKANYPQFEFVYSDLIKAIIAGEWIIIKNIQNCSSTLLDRLNALIEDKTNDLFITESGEAKYIKRHPNFRIFFVRSNIFELNQSQFISNALKNRCIELFISTNQEEYMQHCTEKVSEVDDNSLFRKMSLDLKGKHFTFVNEILKPCIPIFLQDLLDKVFENDLLNIGSSKIGNIDAINDIIKRITIKIGKCSLCRQFIEDFMLSYETIHPILQAEANFWFSSLFYSPALKNCNIYNKIFDSGYCNSVLNIMPAVYILIGSFIKLINILLEISYTLFNGDQSNLLLKNEVMHITKCFSSSNEIKLALENIEQLCSDVKAYILESIFLESSFYIKWQDLMFSSLLSEFVLALSGIDDIDNNSLAINNVQLQHLNLLTSTFLDLYRFSNSSNMFLIEKILQSAIRTTIKMMNFRESKYNIEQPLQLSNIYTDKSMSFPSQILLQASIIFSNNNIFQQQRINTNSTLNQIDSLKISFKNSEYVWDLYKKFCIFFKYASEFDIEDRVLFIKNISLEIGEDSIDELLNIYKNNLVECLYNIWSPRNEIKKKQELTFSCNKLISQSMRIIYNQECIVSLMKYDSYFINSAQSINFSFMKGISKLIHTSVNIILHPIIQLDEWNLPIYTSTLLYSINKFFSSNKHETDLNSSILNCDILFQYLKSSYINESQECKDKLYTLSLINEIVLASPILILSNIKKFISLIISYVYEDILNILESNYNKTFFNSIENTVENNINKIEFYEPKQYIDYDTILLYVEVFNILELFINMISTPNIGDSPTMAIEMISIWKFIGEDIVNLSFALYGNIEKISRYRSELKNVIGSTALYNYLESLIWNFKSNWKFSDLNLTIIEDGIEKPIHMESYIERVVINNFMNGLFCGFQVYIRNEALQIQLGLFNLLSCPGINTKFEDLGTARIRNRIISIFKNDLNGALNLISQIKLCNFEFIERSVELFKRNNKLYKILDGNKKLSSDVNTDMYNIKWESILIKLRSLLTCNLNKEETKSQVYFEKYDECISANSLLFPLKLVEGYTINYVNNLLYVLYLEKLQLGNLSRNVFNSNFLLKLSFHLTNILEEGLTIIYSKDSISKVNPLDINISFTNIINIITDLQSLGFLFEYLESAGYRNEELSIKLANQYKIHQLLSSTVFSLFPEIEVNSQPKVIKLDNIKSILANISYSLILDRDKNMNIHREGQSEADLENEDEQVILSIFSSKIMKSILKLHPLSIMTIGLNFISERIAGISIRDSINIKDKLYFISNVMRVKNHKIINCRGEIKRCRISVESLLVRFLLEMAISNMAYFLLLNGFNNISIKIKNILPVIFDYLDSNNNSELINLGCSIEEIITELSNIQNESFNELEYGYIHNIDYKNLELLSDGELRSSDIINKKIQDNVLFKKKMGELLELFVKYIKLLNYFLFSELKDSLMSCSIIILYSSIMMISLPLEYHHRSLEKVDYSSNYRTKEKYFELVEKGHFETEYCYIEKLMKASHSINEAVIKIESNVMKGLVQNINDVMEEINKFKFGNILRNLQFVQGDRSKFNCKLLDNTKGVIECIGNIQSAILHSQFIRILSDCTGSLLGEQKSGELDIRKQFLLESFNFTTVDNFLSLISSLNSSLYTNLDPDVILCYDDILKPIKLILYSLSIGASLIYLVSNLMESNSTLCMSKKCTFAYTTSHECYNCSLKTRNQVNHYNLVVPFESYDIFAVKSYSDLLNAVEVVNLYEQERLLLVSAFGSFSHISRNSLAIWETLIDTSAYIDLYNSELTKLNTVLSLQFEQKEVCGPETNMVQSNGLVNLPALDITELDSSIVMGMIGSEYEGQSGKLLLNGDINDYIKEISVTKSTSNNREDAKVNELNAKYMNIKLLCRAIMKTIKRLSVYNRNNLIDGDELLFNYENYIDTRSQCLEEILRNHILRLVSVKVSYDSKDTFSSLIQKMLLPLDSKMKFENYLYYIQLLLIKYSNRISTETNLDKFKKESCTNQLQDCTFLLLSLNLPNIIISFEDHINILLREYKQHPILLSIQVVLQKLGIMKLFNINIVVVIVYIELILVRCEPWQLYIKEGRHLNLNIENSLILHIEKLKNCLFKMRRYQIDSWELLLEDVHEYFDNSASLWFGKLLTIILDQYKQFDTLCKIPDIVSEEHYIDHIKTVGSKFSCYSLLSDKKESFNLNKSSSMWKTYNLLLDYLIYSPIGEYKLRLESMEYLQSVIFELNINKDMNKGNLHKSHLYNIPSSLNSSMFLTLTRVIEIGKFWKSYILGNIEDIRKNTEDEIKNLVKLLTWDIKDHLKIRQTIGKTQKQLKNLAEKYKENLSIVSKNILFGNESLEETNFNSTKLKILPNLDYWVQLKIIKDNEIKQDISVETNECQDKLLLSKIDIKLAINISDSICDIMNILMDISTSKMVKRRYYKILMDTDKYKIPKLIPINDYYNILPKYFTSYISQSNEYENNNFNEKYAQELNSFMRYKSSIISHLYIDTRTIEYNNGILERPSCIQLTKIALDSSFNEIMQVYTYEISKFVRLPLCEAVMVYSKLVEYYADGKYQMMNIDQSLIQTNKIFSLGLTMIKDCIDLENIFLHESIPKLALICDILTLLGQIDDLKSIRDILKQDYEDARSKDNCIQDFEQYSDVSKENIFYYKKYSNFDDNFDCLGISRNLNCAAEYEESLPLYCFIKEFLIFDYLNSILSIKDKMINCLAVIQKNVVCMKRNNNLNEELINQVLFQDYIHKDEDHINKSDMPCNLQDKERGLKDNKFQIIQLKIFKLFSIMDIISRFISSTCEYRLITNLYGSSGTHHHNKLDYSKERSFSTDKLIENGHLQSIEVEHSLNSNKESDYNHFFYIARVQMLNLVYIYHKTKITKEMRECIDILRNLDEDLLGIININDIYSVNSYIEELLLEMESVLVNKSKDFKYSCLDLIREIDLEDKEKSISYGEMNKLLIQISTKIVTNIKPDYLEPLFCVRLGPKSNETIHKILNLYKDILLNSFNLAQELMGKVYITNYFVKAIYVLFETNFFNICEKEQEEQDYKEKDSRDEWIGGTGFGNIDNNTKENGKDISEEIEDNSILEGLQQESESLSTNNNNNNNNGIETGQDFKGELEDMPRNENNSNCDEEQNTSEEDNLDRIIDSVDLSNDQSNIEDSKKSDETQQYKDQTSSIETEGNELNDNTDIVAKQDEKEDINNEKTQDQRKQEKLDESNETEGRAQNAYSDNEEGEDFQFETENILSLDTKDEGSKENVQEKSEFEFDTHDNPVDASLDGNSVDNVSINDSVSDKEQSEQENSDIERNNSTHMEALFEEYDEGLDKKELKHDDINNISEKKDESYNFEQLISGEQDSFIHDNSHDSVNNKDKANGIAALNENLEDENNNSYGGNQVRSSGVEDPNNKLNQLGVQNNTSISSEVLQNESFNIEDNQSIDNIDPTSSLDGNYNLGESTNSTLSSASRFPQILPNPLMSNIDETKWFKKIQRLLSITDNKDDEDRNERQDDEIVTDNSSKNLNPDDNKDYIFDKNDQGNTIGLALSADTQEISKDLQKEKESDIKQTDNYSNLESNESKKFSDNILKLDDNKVDIFNRKSDYEVNQENEKSNIERNEKSEVSCDNYLSKLNDELLNNIENDLHPKNTQNVVKESIQNFVSSDNTLKYDIYNQEDQIQKLNSSSNLTILWTQIEREIVPIVNSLTNQLRIILEPTVRGKMQGDFKTGKRLSMKKVIAYIASDYRKDKIWLRRTKPNKREFNVLLCVDNSKSMTISRNQNIAIKSLFIILQSLNRLEVGNFGVCSFGGDTVREILPLNSRFTTNDATQLLESFKFNEESFDSHQNSLPYLLKKATELLRDKSRTNLSKQCHELMIIITDGRFNKQKSKIWTEDGKMKVEPYLENFPFPYYSIIQDTRRIPNVLCDLLKQWFEILCK